MKTFRHDIARWRFKQENKRVKLTYEAVAKAAGVSSSTAWAICSGKGDPGDPKASIVTSLFKSLGLKPEYALNFHLRKPDFHLAVDAREEAR